MRSENARDYVLENIVVSVGGGIGKNSAKRMIDFVILRLKRTFMLIIDSVI